MNATSIALDEIHVTRERQRTDLGSIKDLAESILKYGQLVPVILDENNELIDGFRRYNALRAINKSHAFAVRRVDVSELLFRELELETNIQRKDLTWPERVKSIAELDRLRSAKDPNWTQGQTGAVAGIPQQRVAEAIKMAKLLEIFPELAEAKSLHAAQSRADFLAKTAMRKIDVAAQPQIFAAIEDRIVHGDSVDVIKSLPDGSFHAIVTDPPFGINLEDRYSSLVAQQQAYKDDEESYRRLLSMAPDLWRVLKNDGWLVWFFGPSWYQECVNTFTAAGFLVDPIPVVWDRSDGSTSTNRPDRYFARAYDVALLCIKGAPQMVQRGKPNVLRIPPVPTAERELIAERPVELYEELIRRLTVPGEIVADFFVGSGSCPAAAAKSGRGYWGCERDAKRRLAAITKIRAYTPDGVK